MIALLLRQRRVRQLIKFGLVGTSGIMVNSIFLYLFHGELGWSIPLASAIATEIAILSNFFGNHLFTFKDANDPSPLWRKLLFFQGVSMVALVCTIGLLWLMVTGFGEQLYLVWNVLAIGVAFIINFALNLKFTWSERRQEVAV